MMVEGFDWEAEGTHLGESLDAVHAMVVLGTDDGAVARVAIGIARTQASRRRVALGDLLGETPAIQALLATDDPHGLVDSFVYGVSLNRIAHDVPGVPGLFVMPTGTEPIDAAELYPNPRWRRLGSGFREMGALLLLAARADAPEIAALVAQLDGAVLVGDVVPPEVPVAAVIAAVREPRRTAPPVGAAAAPMLAQEGRRRGRRMGPIAGGVAAAAAIAALGVWLAARPFDRSVERPTRPRADSSRAAATVVPGMAGARDSAAGADSLAGAPPLVVANVADSARAAAFAVELLATNTPAGAAARLREERDVPAATYAPADVGGAQWYKVVVGAYPTRAAADSLLGALRRRGRLDARSGAVVQLPYALVLHTGVRVDSVRALVAAYTDLGQPAYALRQEDGTANVYAGAFDRPERAGAFIASLRASGVTPTLVFRIGRVF